MAPLSAMEIVESLENQRMEREIALREILEERRRAIDIATARYSYPYKAICCATVSFISALSAYRHKNALHIVPLVIAVTYIAHETDISYGNALRNIQDRADAIFRKGLVEPVQPLTLMDLQQRTKDLLYRSNRS